MTDSEYLREVARHCLTAQANNLRAIADRIEAAERDAALKESKSGWLIEHGERVGPVYFCGWRYGNIYLPVWEADHNKAVRFEREQDARAIASSIDCKRRVVEHVWIEAAMKVQP